MLGNLPSIFMEQVRWLMLHSLIYFAGDNKFKGIRRTDIE
ncbi:hypothetical protein DesyoDRAFT_3284 [Desulfosporosinus youngiae DSM 17734]|uniref:Uncharacterized protein n=1 Tax=Desulfosporosinus youngiae DSM 17734 TaxID=768710 RepID=H5XWE5_9FIRM|nr:hypothetical protein DesyoDRAFT_3284 [Desulfosporosinus youngiae DSM 17734]